MVRLCPSCGEDAIIHDGALFADVCTACGTVNDFLLEEREEFDAETNQSSGAFVSHAMGRQGGVSVGKLSNYGNYASKEKRQQTAIYNLDRNIERMMHVLDIPVRLVTEIKGIVFNVSGQELTKQKRVETMIAASIYIACRKNRIALQLADVAGAFNLDLYKLGSMYKYIVEQLNLDMETIDIKVLVEKAVHDMQNDLKKITDKNKFLTQTKALVDIACQEYLDVGRKPMSIVGAAIKIISGVSFKIVAKRLNIGMSSLTARSTELNIILLKYAKHLPWEVNEDNMKQHLPFILDNVEMLKTLYHAKKYIQENDQLRSDNTSLEQRTIDHRSYLPLAPLSSSTIRTSNIPLFIKTLKRKRNIEEEIGHVAPPAFIRSQLDRQDRLKRIERAKKRIQERNNHILQDKFSNDQLNECIDRYDISIEKLLRSGVHEQCIVDGYHHVPVPIDDIHRLEQEQIDHRDMSDTELNIYIRDERHVKQLSRVMESLSDHNDTIERTFKRIRKI
jgi:transcription initiation factor TFIIB